MMTITTSCLCAAALLAISTPVGAQGIEYVSHTITVADQNTNWTHTVNLPSFDPGLGTLQSVEFTLDESVTGHVQIESQDTSPSIVSTQFSSFLSILAPDGLLREMTIPMADYQDTFTAFDGIVDFGGLSGVTHKEITVNNSVTHPLPVQSSQFALFTGAAGAPGVYSLTVTALGSSISMGSGNVITQFAQHAEASVTVTYGFLGNTPPTFTNCPGLQMASVGVPLTFQICASDSDSSAPVTLSVTGMPAGATLTPTLPASGNPICTTFNWTPTNGQVGNTTITFTATDANQRTATCQVTIVSAECHLVLGMGLGNQQELLFGQMFNTQLSNIRRSYPVTMEDMPALPYSALPQTFFVQVLMHNQEMFPANPDQWTYAMRVDKVLSRNALLPTYLGNENGIHVTISEFNDSNGVHRVKFPFTIDGM